MRLATRLTKEKPHLHLPISPNISQHLPMSPYIATRLTKEKPEEASCVSTWLGLGYRVRVRVRARVRVRV